MEKVLDVLDEGIYISDKQGRTLFVNRKYEQLTGFRKEDLLGRLVTELKAEGIFDVIANPEVIKTGQSRTIVQKTQQGRTVILNGNPVFNKQGKVELCVTFVRDVTLLLKMKEQVAEQQEMVKRYNTDLGYFKLNPKQVTLITHSPLIQNLLKDITNIAATDATVLLLGETGVGKDRFARKLHEQSLRDDKPFFKIDCTTLPANLIESELFGYESGAFSGANTKGKPGFIEMADGGTLFLDEIGELPLPMQGKLLRVLQDQEFIRVGGTQVKTVDIRFIAATNRNLEEAVKDGSFRSDLYYRLQVAVLRIPALRERREDIVPLAEFFLQRFNGKYRKNITLSDDVKHCLNGYDWPGNIRELENFIQCLVVTSRHDMIHGEDLPLHMRGIHHSLCGGEKSLGEMVDEFEQDVIKRALEKYGSITEVAKRLKLDRATIYRKMKK